MTYTINLVDKTKLSLFPCPSHRRSTAVSCETNPLECLYQLTSNQQFAFALPMILDAKNSGIFAISIYWTRVLHEINVTWSSITVVTSCIGVISCLLVYTILKFVDTLLIFHEGNQTRHWGFSATKSWAFSCDLLVISIFKIKLRAQNIYPRLWFHRFSAVYRHPKLRKEISQLFIKFLATFVVFGKVKEL